MSCNSDSVGQGGQLGLSLKGWVGVGEVQKGLGCLGWRECQVQTQSHEKQGQDPVEARGVISLQNLRRHLYSPESEYLLKFGTLGAPTCFTLIPALIESRALAGIDLSF